MSDGERARGFRRLGELLKVRRRLESIGRMTGGPVARGELDRSVNELLPGQIAPWRAQEAAERPEAAARRAVKSGEGAGG